MILKMMPAPKGFRQRADFGKGILQNAVTSFYDSAAPPGCQGPDDDDCRNYVHEHENATPISAGEHGSVVFPMIR
jgi:hypothetical protein